MTVAPGPGRATAPLLAAAMPPLFVVIWATGFLVARAIAPHAEPLTFLCMRYALSAASFALIAAATGAAWPRTTRAWADALVAGALIQGVYLGGVFWAARHGMPAGVSALIAGLQPLLTAMLAYPLLGERVGARRWAGIALGFAGAMLVLLPALGTAAAKAVPVPAVLASFAAMAGITLGTIWQKRTAVAADLRTNACVQFLAAAALTIPLAWATESWSFDGSWQVWAGLLWAVYGLSLGAISLLLLLIRRGAVAGVASLFYLVPPVVAALAFVVLGERLAPVQVAGMVLAATGVALASRG